jgi:hypothetical protein
MSSKVKGRPSGSTKKPGGRKGMMVKLSSANDPNKAFWGHVDDAPPANRAQRRFAAKGGKVPT